MSEVYTAAAQLQDYLDQRGWPNCIIGGVAVIAWGRQRTTIDADFTLLTGFGGEREYLEQLSERYPGRWPDEVDFAMSARVYRCVAPDGTPIDIGLAAFPYEEGIIARARPHTFDTGHVLRICELHDLIVMKAFAGRTQDWADLEYLVAWHRKTLDWSRIDQPLEELCGLSENFTSVPRLDELRRRIEQVTRDS